MRSYRIYEPEISLNNSNKDATFVLSDLNFHHLIVVLRLKPDTLIQVFNGAGTEYLATISAITNKKCIIKILEQTQHLKAPMQITLVLPLIKFERLDFAIEKATELGVNTIQLVTTEYTNINMTRALTKIPHFEKIIISACAQSKQNYVPQLNATLELATYLATIKSIATNNTVNIVLAPTTENNIIENNKTENNIIKNNTPITHLRLFIGPEGGFSTNEMALLTNKDINALPVQLGNRILRTETASIAALTWAQLRFGDFHVTA